MLPETAAKEKQVKARKVMKEAKSENKKHIKLAKPKLMPLSTQTESNQVVKEVLRRRNCSPAAGG